MAITPRTILTSPAPATVAVVSLYFFTVLGTAAFTCLTDKTDVDDQPVGEELTADALLNQSDACDQVAQRFGEDTDHWSEYAWINMAYCFDDAGERQLAIDTARLGLEDYPRSEILYNIKGYHQIVLEKHSEAIDTLERGMDNVTHHRNGVMANNLAWAGLWVPDEISPKEARDLYVKSLALSPNVCETLHTGMFVEFAIADKADGIDQFEPRKRFAELRNSYNRCLDRLQGADRKTLAEIIGAAVMFDEMDNAAGPDVQPLMLSATSTLVNDYEDVSVETICDEAMPLADYRDNCVDAVETSLHAHKERAEQRELRQQRVEQVQMEIQRTSSDNGAVIKQRVERNVVPDSGCGGMD